MMLLAILLVGYGLISSALATAPCPTYTPKFFPQKLDHTSNNNTTFQQQYQLVTDFFQPGGPILYKISPETAVMQCIERPAFLDYAKELGAVAATLEHRFFGDSFPPGVNDSNATPEDFAPLTLENVLLDSVTFVDWIKSTVPGANESKVIVEGGSYAGFLATLERLRYPETFYGSMPSAPFLKSLGPLQSNPYKYSWFEWVSLLSPILGCIPHVN
jgi:dipeptidyl-peptidase-2/lysosomal Pro-X carboxypeptidase